MAFMAVGCSSGGDVGAPAPTASAKMTDEQIKALPPQAQAAAQAAERQSSAQSANMNAMAEGMRKAREAQQGH